MKNIYKIKIRNLNFLKFVPIMNHFKNYNKR
jgi:hypothetical protein